MLSFDQNVVILKVFPGISEKVINAIFNIENTATSNAKTSSIINTECFLNGIEYGFILPTYP